MRKIYTNKIQCRHCGEIIESKSVHDYVTCSCGVCSVDGGYFYMKRYYLYSPNDYLDLSEYEDDDDETEDDDYDGCW